VARPTAQEETAAREPHTAPLAEQTQHETLASQNRENFASVNQGRPAVAATAKAGDFSSRSTVSSRAAGGEYHAPTMSPKEARVGTPGNSASGSKANSSEGFRSFSPPSKSAASTGSSTNESRPQTSSQNSSHQQSSANHSASQPKQSAKQNPHKSNQNKHPSAPKEDRHKGR